MAGENDFKTAEDFKEFIERSKSLKTYREPIAFGICNVDKGLADKTKTLQATFPLVNWKENIGSATLFYAAVKAMGEEFDVNASEQVFDINKTFVDFAHYAFTPFLDEATGTRHQNVQVIQMLRKLIDEGSFQPGKYKIVFLYEDAAPLSVESVYLKLYALSLGKVELRNINLNGAFGILPNCAWSGNSPVELEWLRANEIELKMRGTYPIIDFVDKFPRFLQHIIPADNTRILETSKVRFGAQLHAGTTVMPGASYINFNAGTTGSVMVEGRISSSAIVGAGSDVGGGASILGVLSGTDGNPISVGENCLLGANSTCGIPLGDGCIIDAGLAILEGTKVTINAEEIAKLNEVNNDNCLDANKEVYKGKDLAGLNGLHFRQDSTSGKFTVSRSTREIKLNADLH